LPLTFTDFYKAGRDKGIGREKIFTFTCAFTFLLSLCKSVANYLFVFLALS